MKLVRFGESGSESPGVLQGDDTILDVSGFGEDYNEAFFGSDGLGRLEKWLVANAASAPKVDSGVRLGPPIARPSKILCIGLNYSDHAAESGAEVPPEPLLFTKASSSMVGPNDNLIIPKGSTQMDYEVELSLVIKKKANYVDEADALDYVAGYSLFNDYSERGFQKDRSGQWVKGKSADTFAPMGPFLATPDEVGDVHNLRLWLSVNGEERQDGNTSNLIFNVPTVISHLSQFMSLLPGDMISTGTPAGVGGGFNPPRFLKPGDTVELGIDGLGSSAQHVTAYEG